MCEGAPDGGEVVFAGAPGYDGLQPIVEPVANDGYYEVVYAGDAGGAEFGFSEAAQKYVVGDKIYLWNQYRHADR